jgi:hypothetical protein
VSAALANALCGGARTVGDDIDNVTDLVLLEVGRERDHSLLLEVPRKAACCQPVALETSACCTHA